MARKSKKKPSFFKVLSNKDFTKLLRLPLAFLRRNELDLSENVMIRAPYSERKWDVKMERKKNGVFCFTDGWKKFVEDAALKLGEFLVFFLVGKSEFEVVIYETSCCQRDIPSPSTPSLLNDVNKRGRGRGIGRGRPPTCKRKGSNPLYFEICLKEYQQSRISLPKKFTDAAGMKRKRNVRMEYEGVGAPKHNNKWNVVVDHMPHCYRTDLAKGWCRFRKVNKLVYGKGYSFEFIPNKNVIHVEEVK